MSQKFILAGVGTIQLFNPSTGDLIVTSKTLTESGLSFTVTAEDVRGGVSNKILGKYFHDSGMTLKMTDSLFSLQYLSLNVGGTIAVGGDIMTDEQVRKEGRTYYNRNCCTTPFFLENSFQKHIFWPL